MKQFDRQLEAVNLLYVPVGQLPKVNGSYLSNAGSKNIKLDAIQKEFRKKINHVDIEWAKKRLLWQMKKKLFREDLPSIEKKDKKERKVKTEKTEGNEQEHRSVHVVQLNDNIRFRKKSNQSKSKNKNVINLIQKANRQIHRNSLACIIQSPPQKISISAPKALSHKNRHKIKLNHLHIDSLQQSQQHPTLDEQRQNYSSVKLKSERSKVNDNLMKKRSVIERWKERENGSKHMKSSPGEWQQWEQEQHMNLQHLIEISNERQYRLEIE